MRYKSLEFCWNTLIILCFISLLAIFIANKLLQLYSDEIVFLSILSRFNTENLETGFFTTYFHLFSHLVQLPNLIDNLVFRTILIKIAPILLLLYALFLSIACYRTRSVDQSASSTLYINMMLLGTILLLFSIIGRIVEIRPDSLSITLILVAWLQIVLFLKTNRNRIYYLIPLCLLITAGLFAPRGIIFSVFTLPLGLLIARNFLKMKWVEIFVVSVICVAVLMALTLVFPRDVEASLFGGIFNRISSTGDHLTIYTRFASGHRGLLTLIYLLCLVFSIAIFVRSKNIDRIDDLWPITAGWLALSQLALIFLDKHIYEYGYSYGIASPILLTILLLGQSGILKYAGAVVGSSVLGFVLLVSTATNLAGLNVSWILQIPKFDTHLVNSQQNNGKNSLLEDLNQLSASGPTTIMQQQAVRQRICRRVVGISVVLAAKYSILCPNREKIFILSEQFFLSEESNMPDEEVRKFKSLINDQSFQLITWGGLRSAPGPFLKTSLSKDWAIDVTHARRLSLD